MTLRQSSRALWCLTRDTFRQSLAHGIFWILLGVSVICIVTCASAQVVGELPLAAPGETPDFLPATDPQAHDKQKLESSGVQVVGGSLNLAFGTISVPLARDAKGAVRTLELALAAGIVDTVGILLALIWTSGFLPGFLESGSIAVLLTKPTPRWMLLLGKYLGVLAFVLFHGILFVGGTWLALGLRTGVWDTAYLVSIPFFLLQFSIFFGFSALLAVLTRSGALSVFGSIVFWCVCWGMNYGRYALLAQVYRDSRSRFTEGISWLADIGYWILPKPADLGMMIYDALGAGTQFGEPALFGMARQQHLLHPGLSVLASLTFTAVLLYTAVREFEAADY